MDSGGVSCEDSNSCEQFIRWENYQSTVTSFLSTLLTKGSFADVTLVSSEGSRIHAHRVILSACSPYFEEVLENNPCKHPTVILKDVKFVDLKAIITFIYRGEINVETDRISELFQTATSLQVKGLLGAHANYMKNINLKDRCSSPVENNLPVLVSQTPSPPPSPILAYSSRPWMPTTGSFQSTIENVGKGDPPCTSTVPSLNGNAINAVGNPSKFGIARPVEDGRTNNTSTEQPSFIIKAKKKKEAWMDPDAISSRRTHGQKKRYKQTSLISSLARNFPQSTVDLTTLKDYNGGSRSSSQATINTSTFAGSDQKEEKDKSSCVKKKGTKRKSDESVAGDDDKQDRGEAHAALDLSETFFELSPLKGSVVNTRGSPPTTSKKTDYNSKNQKARSPLSPGKLNIIPISSSTDKTRSSESISTLTKCQLDSTINLLKDFDRIPDYKPQSSNKLSRGARKQKQDKMVEEIVCTCIPVAELGLFVDKKELARRKCPIHHTEEPPLLAVNTPENFWCTVQYNTQELYGKGLINVAESPFTPVSRTRRRRTSNETFADDDTENYHL